MRPGHLLPRNFRTRLSRISGRPSFNEAGAFVAPEYIHEKMKTNEAFVAPESAALLQ